MKRGNGFKDLTGQRFGRLVALHVDEELSYPKHIFWYCKCDCGNHVSIARAQLTSGKTQSCGCLQKEYAKTCPTMIMKTENKYIEHENYMECILSNGQSTYFDKNDYDIIKKYSWFGNAGYAYTIIDDDKIVPMHYVLFNDYFYDHVDRDKLNNRRNNLRKCNYSQNNQNHTKRKDNTSGITGVTFHKRSSSWEARINVGNKRITLYHGDSFEEATIARLQAEKKYYGEFAPQKHLYDQYGIV